MENVAAVDQTLYDQREAIRKRIVDCQDRYRAGERGPQLQAEFDTAAHESSAFDAAHPEIKIEVKRRLLEYHQRLQPFTSRA